MTITAGGNKKLILRNFIQGGTVIEVALIFEAKLDFNFN